MSTLGMTAEMFACSAILPRQMWKRLWSKGHAFSPGPTGSRHAPIRGPDFLIRSADLLRRLEC